MGPLWLFGLPFRGAQCLHFDILGSHFKTSGAPWRAILAFRGHQGGSWEQQDGPEAADNRNVVDLGVISGGDYASFFEFKIIICLFCSGLVSRLSCYRF